MFHRHVHEDPPEPSSDPGRPGVRVLHGGLELSAALQRARAFERRGADEYQRRLEHYERWLDEQEDRLAPVVPIEPGEVTSDHR